MPKNVQSTAQLHSSPRSMGFFRQEYWSGLSFPSPGDLPDPGIEPGSWIKAGSPSLQADALPCKPPGKHPPASKVILKIPQARRQQCVNCELPDVQAGFRKGRGTRDQIANILWIMEKTRVPEKHLFLLYWLCQSLWLCGSQSTVENSERDGNTRPPDLPLEKPVCRLGNNS